MIKHRVSKRRLKSELYGIVLLCILFIIGILEFPNLIITMEENKFIYTNTRNPVIVNIYDKYFALNSSIVRSKKTTKFISNTLITITLQHFTTQLQTLF